VWTRCLDEFDTNNAWSRKAASGRVNATTATTNHGQIRRPSPTLVQNDCVEAAKSRSSSDDSAGFASSVTNADVDTALIEPMDGRFVSSR